MHNLSCCTLLAHTFGAKLSFPASAGYLATEQSYWSLQERSLAPACILIPESADDVSKAVSILSADSKCLFAIKGQSHAPAAGFANIEGGVTIDMAKLDGVSVSPDHTVAHVGAGASWLDVYQYLDTFNLSVAGGRNGRVGVAGLTLGGGISYFAPRVGFACDNVINFEIVLACGDLVDVNITSAPDLFRALKGGGNNFGIVTRFDLAAFPQGEILVGPISSPFSERDAVFKAFTDLAGDPNYDPYVSLVTGVTWLPSTGWGKVVTTAAYTKPTVNPPPVLKQFIAVPNTTSALNSTKLSTVANERATPLWEWTFHTATYGVSALLLSKITTSFNETLTHISIPSLILWSFALEPLPIAITQHSRDNSLGVSPADGNGVVLLLNGIWNNTADDALVAQTANKMLRDANDIANGMGLLRRFQYINYADPSQDPIASYGAENVRRLKEASRKYDPKGVFQKQVPGGFKLPEYFWWW